MSNPYSYNPKVANPNLRNNIPQMRSGASQPPFYFGGAQAPTDLFLMAESAFRPKSLGLISSFNKSLGHNVIQTKSGKKQIPRHLPFF
jgi:hypothetical protein